MKRQSETRTVANANGFFTSPDGVNWRAVAEDRDRRLISKELELQQLKADLQEMREQAMAAQMAYAKEQEISSRLRCDVESQRRSYVSVRSNWERCSQMIRDLLPPENVEQWRQENPRD